MIPAIYALMLTGAAPIYDSWHDGPPSAIVYIAIGLASVFIGIAWAMGTDLVARINERDRRRRQETSGEPPKL